MAYDLKYYREVAQDDYQQFIYPIDADDIIEAVSNIQADAYIRKHPNENRSIALYAIMSSLNELNSIGVLDIDELFDMYESDLASYFSDDFDDQRN